MLRFASLNTFIKRANAVFFFALVLLVSVNASTNSTNSNNTDGYVFYIMQESWHTGFIIRTSDVPDSLWPQIKQFNNRNFIDVGWGDEDFYQHPGISIYLALRAAVIPTSSALRVSPFNTHPEIHFAQYANLFKITATQEQFYSLINYIADSFTLDEDNNLTPSSSNRFFKSNLKYHLFRTCNTWVARGLRDSGYGVRWRCVLTRRQLARQLSRIEDECTKLF